MATDKDSRRRKPAKRAGRTGAEDPPADEAGATKRRRRSAAEDAPGEDAEAAAQAPPRGRGRRKPAAAESATAGDGEGPAPRKRARRRRTPEPEAPANAADGDAEAEEKAPDSETGDERPGLPPLSDEEFAAIQAEALAEREEEDDEDEGPDDAELPRGPVELGPVFTGEVPLETPEQRLAAMQKAAARLGIQRLHPEQERVIEATLTGRDVLMVLPTGFGKSACYQIPSMILPRPVLVISPLLALMRDQYEKLQKLQVPCVKLDGTVRGGARRAALERIASGDRVLVMTTPETLGAPDAAEALGKSGLSLAAVDEAHCISEWGYDFRPAYLQIGERLRTLGAPPVLALTATATEKVRLAIQRFVGMRDPRIVASSPHRDNLAFDVLHCGGGARHRALARLALRVRRPGIIYCSTTREVDEIYTILQRFGIPSHRYHGKMSGTERSKSQDAFMHRGRRTVMVATNAFGLGIDKADIRYVMHYQSPASLEQYVQEAGRAGRDGRRSNCIMLFSHEDRAVHEALLSRSRVRPEQLYRLGSALAAWAEEEKVPSVQALALSAELGARTAGALLALLEEATLVRWDQSAVYVTVPADEIEPRSRELAGQFDTLRTQDARRLDAVAEYAYTDGCRAVFLKEYFGEEGGEPCGMCDRCRGQEDRPSSFWQPLAPPREPSRRKRGRGGRTSERGAGRKGRGGRRRSGRSGRDDARGRRRGRGGKRPEGGGGDEKRPARPEARSAERPQPQPQSAGNGGDGSGRRRRRRGRRGSRGRGRGRRPGDGGPRPEGGRTPAPGSGEH